jgi:hypothetical protein
MRPVQDRRVAARRSSQRSDIINTTKASMNDKPRRRMRGRRWLLVAFIGVVAGALAPVVTQAAGARPGPAGQQPTANLLLNAAVPATTAAKPPKEGDVRGHRRILLVTYAIQKPCVVLPNYPRNPGGHKPITVTSGKIIWRYNVSRTVAAVAVPGATFPHWGFVTDRSCIGRSTGQASSYQVFHNGRWVTKKVAYPAGQPVPNRILSGRSQFKPYWKHVDWRPSHAAVPAGMRRLGHNATLRDAANQFVIGNVYSTWQVRPTPQHSHGMTKVYVPALRRWGWLEL